ncbi:unnamed protein product [Prorocentrum cordatum]|uniref:Uncharacterized protein n=1 Tax=Prorocentrum cordatum TaxID=2364126 RepID=A0ABN9X2W0_9DINO|nr:unnamed protein product [Polarella glacialis]
MATPAWFQAARPGDRVLVCYFQDAGGAAVEWHERVLLGHVSGSKWVAISRDFDIFEEDFAEADGPRQFLANGQLPAALRGLPHFLIDHYQFGQDRQYYMETGEALARGLRPAAPAAPGPALGDGGPGALVPAEGAAPLVEKWFALEGRGAVQRGDALTAALESVDVSANDRCLFKLLDGTVLTGGLEGALPAAPGGGGGDDSRILPAKQDGQRRFRRSFASALQDMQLVEFKDSWEIEGPRSAYFTAEWVHDGNHSPVQRHYWWRSVMGLSATDVGVDEHLLLSQLIEVAMTVDQVQICNLATFELVSRRYQMWESAYKDLLREVDTGGSGGDDWLNERSCFLGVKNHGGSAIIMPELEDFVAKELASRAAVLKERRKAISASQQMRQRDVLPISLAAASEVSAVRHLAQQYGSVAAPPPDCGGSLGAWQSLQGSRPGYMDDVLAVGVRANFERGNVSLHAGLSGRVSLSECLPLALQSALEDRSILLSEDEAAARRENFDGSLFLDPVLRDNPKLFGEFVSELWEAGVVEVSDDALEESGMFFVRKKSGALRLIWDTRVPNLRFREPPGVVLPSGEALGHLECRPRVIPVLHGGDVEVCYYQFALPEQYRCFFGLPALPIAHLSPSLVASLPDAVRDRGWARVRAHVVPMGWNWAVALVQAANQYQLDGLSPEAPWLLDKVPLPPLGDVGSLRGLYIDGFVSLAHSKSVATSDVLGMQSRLADLGIVSTLGSSEAGDNDFIGFTLVGSSGEWRPKSSRFWRLKLASDYLLEVRPSIAGQELERFAGHVTALFSLSPELLCLMEKVYVFIHESCTRRQLCGRLCIAKFGGYVLCFRWRGRRCVGPGRHQEELEIAGASEANILGLGRARAFVEVPADLVERGWTVAYAGRWSSTPAMNFQCRLTSATALAVGLKLYDRWAPSELSALRMWQSMSGTGCLPPARLLLAAPPDSDVEGAAGLGSSSSRSAGAPTERVRPATQAGYCDVLEPLADFLGRRPLPTLSGPQWDSLLLNFVEWVRGEGWSRALASRPLPAVVWAQPTLGGPLRQVFPGAHAAMLGWRQLEPAHSRPPLPWGVVLALAWAMLPECPVGALAIIVMFETYMRPSELLSLTVGQLVPPTASRGQGAFWGFYVHVEELGRPSKTQEFDLSVLLDLDRHRPLIPVLLALQGGRASGGPLFDVSSRQLYRSFALAVEHVVVSCIEPISYALLHGGASHDRLVRARSLVEVQQRGHWRSFRSVVRYDKHARVSFQLGKLSAVVRNQISALVDRGFAPFAVHCARLLHSRSRAAAGSS